MNVNRRDLLKLLAAGSGLMAVPWLARGAQAAPREDAPAKRVLLVNLTGGIRSSAAFYASQQVRYNPFGIIDGTATPFPVGKLLDDHLRGAAPLPDSDYTLSALWKSERVPRLREMVRECSVLGTWDPERGDHIRARIEEPTGSPAGDKPGILTRIAAGLTQERGALAVLPFQISPFAAFGQAGGLGQFCPVSLQGPRSLPVETSQAANDARLTGNDWARDDAMRERLDQKVIAKRARNAKTLAEVLSVHRRASRVIGHRLAEPWVNVGSQDPRFLEAAYGNVALGGAPVPLTNAMLVELFDKTLSSPDPETATNRPSAQNAALAIRLLQLGSPAVCLEIPGFDLHSQERDEAPPLYSFLGRVWATLNWLMKRVPDPETPGRSLYETTLILTMSDFGRDPGSATSGFNGGEGSDHGSDPSCYYLAHLAMGAGVKPGRVLSQISTDDYRGDRAADRFGQRDLLAMLLWSLGLDHKNPEWGLDEVSAPIDGLFRA